MKSEFHKNILPYLRDAPLVSLIVSPVIYSLIFPLILLDLWLWIFQLICFTTYKIKKVQRSEYILFDRGRLKYLNLIESYNCNYCAYANGLIAYTREIASRTEQYFCPIKHKLHIKGSHRYYNNFLEYGDGSGFRKNLSNLRDRLK